MKSRKTRLKIRNESRKSALKIAKMWKKNLFLSSNSLLFFLSSSSFSRGKACDPWNEIGREGEREMGKGGGRWREGDNKRCKW